MAEVVRVTSIDDIPDGEGRAFEVGGRCVAVFNVAGRFHAIDNVCAHQRGPLAEGELDGCVVTCPWHGWTYDVTTGVSPEDPGIRVQHFDVTIAGSDLLVVLPER